MARRVTPQLLGRITGAFFVVLGVLGFIPGVTHDPAPVGGVNAQTSAELFGAFHVSGLLNVARIGVGVLGLVVSRTAVGARLYLIWCGLVFFGLWIYGVAVHGRWNGRLLPIDRPDNWLRLGIAVGMLTLAWIAAAIDSPASAVTEERAALEELERDGAERGRDDLLAGLGWLVLRGLDVDDAALHGPTRRAVLLLAAGGDPRRGLTLEGRAVSSLAEELDQAVPADELGRSLASLRIEAHGLPLVSRAIFELASDSSLARRAAACALLAEELEE